LGERERENELHETSFGLALVASPTVSVHLRSTLATLRKRED